MAMLSVVGDRARIIFILCVLLTTIQCLNDYHFYNTDERSNDFIAFYQHEHHMHKRDTTDTTNEATNETETLHQFNRTQARMKLYPQSSPKKTLSSGSITPATETTSQPPIIHNPTKVISMTEPTQQAKDVLVSKEIKDAKDATETKEVKESKTPKKVITNNTNVVPNVHVEEDDDISINKFADPSFNLNKTLKNYNISVMQSDAHIYYNSSFRTDEAAAKHFWVDVDGKVEMKISDLLSKSHRRAATVRLSFDFPFYGHYIRNVTIATGGFLYTGDYVHSWLAATQYIAPLMANFDTSLSNDSYIKYVDNSTSFTVLWENVALQDKPNDGKFTFQTTLHSNGDIVFVYQNVPLIIENIQDDHHPVKVGLSDAYIIDRTIFFVRRKTIYEYHRVNFRKEDIMNGTVVYLTALPTCTILKNCTTCLTKPLANFQCAWCPSLNKCSNGLDRSRQEWLTKSCDKRHVKNDSECGQPYSEILPDDHELEFNNHDHGFDSLDDPTKASRVSHDSTVLAPSQPVRMGVSSVVAILFLVSLLSGIVFWVFYAFRNPHTTSGQILIRYRPSQWSWRRGEARYTAATIHM